MSTSHPLHAFIPMAHRQAIEQGTSLPTRTHGAALFADISGFTPFTNALVAELGSQRGPEELTRHLNRIYTALISQVHRYHGSVMNFSGDAILCWFATTPTISTAEAVQLATACAWEMQTMINSLAPGVTPKGTTITFAIKISVTAGTAQRFLVGSPNHKQIATLAGSVINRTAFAEKLIHKGEIAVGAEVLSHFGHKLPIKAWRQSSNGEYFALIGGLKSAVPPQPWPTLELHGDHDFSPWVLPLVADRLQQGHFMAQLRPCVALFVKFNSLDFDEDEGASHKLDAYIRWVQTIIARYEGHLIQLTLGDKGSYLYVTFGALISHENNATRAVATAVALQNRPDKLSFITNSQMGISQGQMYTGTYGSPEHYTFGVLGNEVNIAARLMGQAETNQILLSASICDHVPTYTFTTPTPLSLKGVDAPLLVASVIATVTDNTVPLQIIRAQTPLVGRATELQILCKQVDNLAKGETGVVIIEGEAGMGKSHLLTAWREQITIPFIVGAAEAIEQITPYYVWRQIFRQLWAPLITAKEPQEGRLQLEAEFRRLWGDDDPDLALLPLLTAISTLEWPETEATTQLMGEGRAHKTHRLLSRILQEEAQRQPLFLIIEDAHWLDASSWELIRLITVDVNPLLLAIITRPLAEPWPVAYHQLQRLPYRTEITLDKLSPSEMEAMLCAQLNINNLPEDISTLIYERANGHPFFSEQLMYGLIDAKVIVVEGRECYLVTSPNQQPVDIPQTVQEVIASRLDRLTIPEQLALKVASVIGRTFNVQLLTAMHPIEKDKANLDDYLHQLTHKNLILGEPPVNHNYLFKHMITQEVVYNSILFAQRQKLHRAVASWYEEQYEDLKPHYPLLAHHWQQADDPQQALLYWQEAGQAAMHEGAYQEALHFWEQLLLVASDILPRPTNTQRASWLQQLGTASRNLGRFQECKTHLTAALALLERPLPTTRRRWQWQGILKATKELTRSWFHRGKRPQPSPTSTEDEIALQIYREFLIIIYFENAPIYIVLYILMELLSLATKMGHWGALTEIYGSLAIGFIHLRLPRLSTRYAQLATNLMDDLEEDAERARAQMPLAGYHFEHGRFDIAQTIVASSAELSNNQGYIHIWLDIMGTASPIIMMQGDLISAYAIASQTYQAATRYHDIYQQGWQAKHLSTISWRQGNVEEALEWAQRSVTIMQQEGSTMGQIMAFSALLLAQVGTGRLALATQTAPKVMLLLPEINFPTFALYDVHVALVEYALATWDQAQTPTQLAEVGRACHRLRQWAYYSHPSRPWAAIAQGRYDWHNGRPAAALKWLTKAIQEADNMNMPYEAGWAHYHLGRFLLGSDPNGRAHLKEALEIFERIGANHAYQQVEKILS